MMRAASSGRTPSRPSRWWWSRSTLRSRNVSRKPQNASTTSSSPLAIDVLLDDRDERPGVKFADSELIGIPHRVVVGDRGLEKGVLEYRHRRAESAEEFPAADALAFLRGRSNTAGVEEAAT